MKENAKPLYIGIAIVLLLGISVFIYKRSNSDVQSAYNPKNGIPDYVKNRSAGSYGNNVKGQGAGAAPAAGGPPRYGGPR